MAGWDVLPDDVTLGRVVEGMKGRGFEVRVVESAADALENVRKMIPPGSEVMNGSSATLAQIGFTELLAGKGHGWRSLHDAIKDEPDQARRAELRRKASTAEYFVSGVNAITGDGALVSCDASGSRVGAYPFAAKHLVIVSGTNKVTGSLEEAMRRVREYAFRLEDERARKAYGVPSRVAKWVIMEGDYPGRVKVVLVKEKLGF